MSKKKGRLFIGTSGWSYDHWEGPFYPVGLAPEDRLDYYADRFSSAEINNAFYQLPEQEVLERWRDVVPADFVFTVKASRYITHMKKLNDPADSLQRFLARIRALGKKLGPVLFQLPPRWGYDGARLSAFLDMLEKDLRYTFEFRDHSWLNDEAFQLLGDHGAALCIYDLDGFTSPRKLTADFVYLRLHGPDGPYQGSYDAQSLSGWAGALSAWSAKGIDGYCYFDNDEGGHAPCNASRLQAMLED